MVVGVMGESVGADGSDDEGANQDENGRNRSRDRANFKRRQTYLCIVGIRQTLFGVHFDPASPTQEEGVASTLADRGNMAWLHGLMSGCQGVRVPVR
jgi:hypothetical protein